MHWVDPDFLPATRGTLARFLLNPKADIDGLLLTDGTEVHTPPHLSEALLKALAGQRAHRAWPQAARRGDVGGVGNRSGRWQAHPR